MEQLIHQLKEQLIEALNLEELTPEELDADASLFGDGLGLDSIDALEIILILDKEYGIKMKSPNESEIKKIFKSVRSLAEYIEAERKK